MNIFYAIRNWFRGNSMKRNRFIVTIEGEPIIELDDNSIVFNAKAAIDTDGSGPMHGDPVGQHDTSLHQDGKPLNADIDKYVVVPPSIIHGVTGIVLGCQAFLKNISNGRSTDAVVGDIGPKAKIGEISVACAKALGIPSSPVSGGITTHTIHYSLKPGTPASVDGKQYTLQKA